MRAGNEQGTLPVSQKQAGSASQQAIADPPLTR
jgi:hypothetical protein